MRMTRRTPLPVADALQRRRRPRRKPQQQQKIRPDEHGTPLAVLELHGCSMPIIEFIEEHAEVHYLGDIAYWTDADLLRVENIGEQSVIEFRAALNRYLRGSMPRLSHEFNAVNPRSLASARDGKWVLSANMNGARHEPWT